MKGYNHDYKDNRFQYKQWNKIKKNDNKISKYY